MARVSGMFASSGALGPVHFPEGNEPAYELDVAVFGLFFVRHQARSPTEECGLACTRYLLPAPFSDWDASEGG